jgi:hypothetical protein
MRQFFLWTQGQLQALLPHQVMVALQFAPSGALRRLECLHARCWRRAPAAGRPPTTAWRCASRAIACRARGCRRWWTSALTGG